MGWGGVGATQNQGLKASTRVAEGPYLYLLHTGPLKPQIKAVICQAANLLTVPVIAHADDWNLGVLYEQYEFLSIKKKKTAFDDMKGFMISQCKTLI